jgi:hypothetical protein
MMLAQTAVNIPLSDTTKTLVGIMGVLTCGLMAMWFVIAWKKLFGQQPPIGEALAKLEKKLRAEIIESHARVFTTSENAQARADEAHDKLADFVPQAAFDRFVDENRREHENIFSKMGGVERGARAHLDSKLETMQKASEQGRDKLHDRINDVLSAVSELRGTVNELKRD